MFIFEIIKILLHVYFNTQVWLAFAGVLCIGLAIGITYGLSSAFQLFVSPVHSVLPFLLLGKLVTYFCASIIFFLIFDALHDLVPFIQFKKCKKYPWRSVKPANLLKVTLLHGGISRFLELLAQAWFVANKADLDIYHENRCTRTASRIAERIKTYYLRKFGNIKETPKLGGDAP